MVDEQLRAPLEQLRHHPKRWLNGGRATWMRALLASEHGRERYATRKQTVEPLYGDTKHNQRVHLLSQTKHNELRTEFRLLMMAHNLTKVHRHQLATAGP